MLVPLNPCRYANFTAVRISRARFSDFVFGIVQNSVSQLTDFTLYALASQCQLLIVVLRPVGEADHRPSPECAYRRPFETSSDLIKGAIQRLVDRAIESGDVRPDLDPFRLRALVDVSNVASVPDWPQSAKETVRYPPPG